MTEQKFTFTENDTTIIADLDCGEGENPDTGLDICAVTDKDTNGFGEDTEKPTSYVLTLGEELTSEINSTQGNKLEVGAVMSGDDGDGTYYILVSRDDDPEKTDQLFFSGDVTAGGSFVADGTGSTSFGSETFVHIFSSDGGTLLQTINFHTSCSAPLVIGDQYGSITLEGASLEGKDSGTIYTVGLTEVDGDAGVVYEITQNEFDSNGDPVFQVDPETGEVTFISPPDFENPLGDTPDNKYDIVVTAFFLDENGVKTDEICDIKPLEICVEDDCINILENTSPVIADLDCGEGENPDTGLDICAVTDKDTNGFGEDTEKPTSYVLTLGEELTSEINSTQGNKLEVGAVMSGDDGDGTYYILVSRDDDPEKTDQLFFSGDVTAGGSFVADGTGSTSFGSETFVHIFSSDGGTLLQTINFHTSCSAPLVIGDQYGSITLEGASLEGKDSGTIYTVGLTEVDGDAGVVYEITQNEFDSNGDPVFQVDPETGEVTFISPPDFENPLGDTPDNKYDIVVTAFFLDENGVKTDEICDIKPLEICVEDDCINILENTSPVIADLDCGEGENPDTGLDICAVTDKDTNGFGEDTEKPTSYVLTLGEELTSEINSTQGNKLEVGAVMSGDDGDGTYYILVSRDDDPEKTDQLFFSGDVTAGGSFVADGTGSTSFGSETFVHIFSSDGGTLLQTINFHTSCSAPLVIGDQYGSITLEGASLEGKDSGTIYTVGLTEVDGDAGVVYEITQNEFDSNGDPVFQVDPETGEVTFISPPDFENPLGDTPDNKYDIVVTAFFLDENGVKTDEICDIKPLEICVEDQDCISIVENTNPGVIADLDCEEKDENPDFGKEICTERDALRDQGIDADKPNQLTLTLNDELTSIINSAQEGGKLEVDTFELVNPDGGGLYVRVSDDEDPSKLDTVYFSADVGFGQSFTATASAAGDDKFGSETYIHIFSANGGQLLQTINYHTSCSAPITIGDQLGLVSLEGVGLLNKDTGGTIEFGGTAQREVFYEITGGDGFDENTGASPFFNVDPETGEVTLAFTPDFENPLDDNMDNNYFVEVTGYFVNADGSREVCEVKPIEICIEDEVEVGSLSGRYFCDENDNDVDDGQAVDPGVAGVVVTALAADGTVAGRAVTDTDGSYSIAGLAEGIYSVVFTDPDGVLAGKELVTPNVGEDDTIDSDAVGDTVTATIEEITVSAGQDTPDNDAGAEKLPGSLSGRYFCDENDNDVDDGQAVDPGVAGVVVTALAADGTVAGRAVTDTDGSYSIAGLAEGIYSVVFTDPDGVLAGKELVTPNVGEDDTIDSDAVGDTVTATIEEITVSAGQDTPDNDAGAEKLPGSLSGRYFCDENDNDVDDGQAVDPGVAGVVVTALAADGTVAGRAVTDTDGSYSIAGLAEGIYSVVFTDPDGVLAGKELVTPNVGEDDTIDSDAVGDTVTATIEEITVSAGQDTPDNDAGAEKLPGSLSGRYFCDENDNDVDDGQAVDPGVAGVVVTALAADGTVAGRAVTDTDGSYSIAGLAEGIYSVVFTDPDGVLAGKELVTPNVGEDDTIDSDAVGDTVTATIEEITVSAGQDTPDNDAGAEKLPGSLSGRYFCDENDNDVDDGQAVDPGVAGVVVTALAADGTVAGRAVTDTDGSYSIAGLAEGIYSVVFTDPDGVLAGKELVTPNVGEDDTIDSDAVGDTVTATIEEITVSAGQDTPDNDAGAEKLPGSLSGRYFCDENDNDVDDGQAVDPGVAGVVVTALAADGTVAGRAVTDTDGSYSIAGLAEGIYSVVFTDPDGVLAGKELVTPNVGEDDTIDSDAVGDTVTATIEEIAVSAGQDTPDNDAGAEKLPGSLSGRYFCDENDNDVDDGQAVDPGVAGVVVTALAADGTVAGRAVTDTDGSYSIAGLAEGIYSVVFTDPDGVLAGKELVTPNVGEDDTIDSDAVGDTVTATIEEITVSAGQDTPDNDAGAEKLPGSLSGRYFCDENDNDVDDGQAVDPGVAGVVVTALAADGTVAGRAVTDTDGSYSIAGLAEGIYSVVFTDPDGVLAGKELVTPNVGEDDTIDSDAVGDTVTATIEEIAVSAGQDTPDNDAGAEKLPGSLSGRYFCDENDNDVDDGQAVDPGVAGVVVTALAADGTVAGRAVTDTDGSYSIAGLAEGIYSVVFTDPDGVLAGKELVTPNVGEDDTIDSDAVGDTVTATIEEIAVSAGQDTPDNDAGAEKLPGSLSGRYFCDENDNDVDDGQAVDPGVAGVVVTALAADGTVAGRAVTDTDGSYSIAGLAEGIYSVVFTDPDGVLAGKELVTPNVGEDDTIDSDAVGDTVTATIEEITVSAGQDTPDNDAGAEKLPGSLSGRYFCDENDNDVDDGQAVDPGVAGVVVTALAADGTVAGRAVTDTDGSYSIAGLAEGIYSVVFTDPDGVLAGKELVTPNVGEDDTIDSDAVGDTVTATIEEITVSAGQDTPDNDAGAEKLPGSLSGRYFCDENDNDVDDGEKGVANREVTLTGAGADSVFGTADDLILTTVTSEDGSYAFTDLAQGDYTISIRGTGFVAQDVGDDAIDSDVDATGTTDVLSLAEGQALTDIDAGTKCFEVPTEGLLGFGGTLADDIPVVRFGFGEDPTPTGTITYTAATGSLSGVTSLDFTGVDNPVIFEFFDAQNAPDILFDLTINETGGLVADETQDILIYFDENGNGSAEEEEILLDAKALVSGFAAGETDSFEFILEVEGGSLAQFFDPLIGLELGLFLSDFTSLEEDFSAAPKGFIGDVGIDCFCVDEFPFV